MLLGSYYMPIDTKILEIRKQLINFLKSDQMRFEFEVDCDLKHRIKFIYKVIFPGWKQYQFYLKFLIARVAQFIDYSSIKIFLYRIIGIKIGKGVFISPDVLLDPHFPCLIEIRDFVIIGWGTQLFTHEFIGGTYTIGRIIIDEGAVIGGFATIRSGTKIGKRAEVAFRSLVYKDVPDNLRYGVRDIIKQNRN